VIIITNYRISQGVLRGNNKGQGASNKVQGARYKGQGVKTKDKGKWSRKKGLEIFCTPRIDYGTGSIMQKMT
jgi:hypothetical protein